MKKNLYYATTFRRYNMIKYTILALAWRLASYPRLVLEVIIRRDFGHRYFNISSALIVFALLAWLPMLRFGFGFDFETFYYAVIDEPVWYGYVFTFLYFSIKRHRELRVKPGHYDFTWFSESAGLTHKWFYTLKYKGKIFDNRTIEIWLEPLPFFLAGLLLLLLHNILGILLVICAVIYSLSYSAAYALGDGLIWDIVDNKLVNESTEEYYNEGELTLERTGVHFYTHRPTDKKLGKVISDTMQGKDDDFDEGTSYAF